jgi:hypothetical protein
VSEPNHRLHEAQQAEALALLNANQRARLAAWQLSAASFALLAATVVVAVASRNDDVLMVLPPLLLALQSLLFQLFGDVTVLGAARAALEARVNQRLASSALIYESAVAPIRKRPPLVGSVRVLQAVSGVAVAGAVVAGLIVAFDDQPAAVSAGVSSLTLLTAISAGLSYRDMLRSWPAAAAHLEAELAREAR